MDTSFRPWNLLGFLNRVARKGTEKDNNAMFRLRHVDWVGSQGSLDMAKRYELVFGKGTGRDSIDYAHIIHSSASIMLPIEETIVSVRKERFGIYIHRDIAVHGGVIRPQDHDLRKRSYDGNNEDLFSMDGDKPTTLVYGAKTKFGDIIRIDRL